MGDPTPSTSASTAPLTISKNIDYQIQQAEEELRNFAKMVQNLEEQLKEYKAKYSTTQDKLNDLRSKKHAEEVAETVRTTSETLKTKWIEPRFPWSEKVEVILHEKFHFDSFRSVQLAAINAVLSKKDVIVVMPTGGGKSLIYQIPAVLNKGYAVVIIPLLSLAYDQMIALERYGIKAATLNSSTSQADIKTIYEQMTDENTNLKAVFVTPEMVKKNKRLMNNLQKAQQMKLLSLIVVDEVHCCSTWGHDFRPDYRFLGIMKDALSGVPFLGLTATATQRVIDDILSEIPLAKDRLIITAPFNRPNLIYQVITKLTKPEHGNWMVCFIKKYCNEKSGIVYTTTIKDALDVANLLKTEDIAASPYHADMETRDKKRIHDKWLSGKIKVIVATVAFGMGIDKSDVRFVIHYSMPRSMENFYQESGRAGRDGEPAYCVLMFTLSDFFKIAATIDSIEAYRKALAVLEYCINNHICRRFYLGKHFNVLWKSVDCNKMCDICNKVEPYVKAYNLSDVCADIQEIIENAIERLTLIRLCDRWTKHNKTAAKKKYLIRLELELIIGHLLTRKYLEIDRGFNMFSAIAYIKVGSPTEKDIIMFCLHPIGLPGFQCAREMLVDAVENGDDPLLILKKAERIEARPVSSVLILEDNNDDSPTKQKKSNEQQRSATKGVREETITRPKEAAEETFLRPKEVVENHSQKNSSQETGTHRKGSEETITRPTEVAAIDDHDSGNKEKEKEETYLKPKEMGVNCNENKQECETKGKGEVRKIGETFLRPKETAENNKENERTKAETFKRPKEVADDNDSPLNKKKKENDQDQAIEAEKVKK